MSHPMCKSSSSFILRAAVVLTCGTGLAAGAEDAAAPRGEAGADIVAAPAAAVNTNGATLINGYRPSLEGEDHFLVSVGDTATYDDNLFRIPASLPADSGVAGIASRGDDINTPFVALDGQWTVGRQALNVNLRGAANRFAHNDGLNNTSANAALGASWRVGSYLFGQVGAIYTHQLTQFVASRYYGRDMVDAKQYFGTANLEFGPHWSWIGGIRQVDSAHSAEPARPNDFHSKSGSMEVQYALSAENTLGVEYRYTTGHYPLQRDIAGVPFNSDYREHKTNVILGYALTAKMVLDFSAGYLRRDYPHESTGAFSGDIWRGSLQWRPTEKTQVTIGAWRELQAYLDAQSDYFVSRGESIAPTWLASEKLRLSFLASREDQTYINSSPSSIALGSRRDNLTAEQATVTYTPRQSLEIGLSFRAEQRRSPDFIFNYDDKLARLSATLTF